MQEEDSSEETEQRGWRRRAKMWGSWKPREESFHRSGWSLVGQMHRSRGGEGIP